MIRTGSIGLALAIVSGGPAPVEAQSVEVGDVLTIASGEVREGDVYAAGEAVRVDGRLNGDLVAGARRILVDGRVEGDVFAAGNTIDLRGPIGDSTRIAGQILTVDTTIDGDLLAGGEELHLTENASVAGGLTAAASLVEIDGTVGNGARVAAGEIIVRGTVNGNANVIADRLDLAPGARITGDLDYRARDAPQPRGGPPRWRERCATRSRSRIPTTAGGDSGSRSGSGRSWRPCSRASSPVAALRGVLERLVASIAEETTLGALLGFTAFLLIPVAAVIAIVTLVGLPIGVAAALLFGLALYAAKLPIAVWIGGRLLGLAGRPGASPYAAMAIGILLLYLLFAIPFVGWLFWLAAAWLGLGAMVVSGRRYLDSRASAA